MRESNKEDRGGEGNGPSCGLDRRLTMVEKSTQDDFGPMQEYDRRVDGGLLRNDEHQRGTGASR